MDVNARGAPEGKIEVKTKRVVCDGGGGSLGHPKVYLEMGNMSDIMCPYCSRHYRYLGKSGGSLRRALRTD